MARTTTRRRGRQAPPPGRFARAGQPARRPGRRPPQRSQGPGGALGQIARFAPAVLGKLAGGSGRGRGGFPVNPKLLTGLLGAGAAGTALARKRRARRAREDPEASPTLPPS